MNNPSLVKCFECGHSISSQAHKCPNPKCSHPEHPHGVVCIYCGQKEKASQALFFKGIRYGYDSDISYKINVFSHKSCHQKFNLLKITCSLCSTTQNIYINRDKHHACQQCGHSFEWEDLTDSGGSCAICHQIILKGLKSHQIIAAHNLKYKNVYDDDMVLSSINYLKVEGLCHEVCLDVNYPEWRDEVRRVEAEENQRRIESKIAYEQRQREQEKNKKQLEENSRLKKEKLLKEKRKNDLKPVILVLTFSLGFFVYLSFENDYSINTLIAALLFSSVASYIVGQFYDAW